MAYIVCEICINCKYKDCIEVCPADCFYEGENFMVINPDECIDCGLCEPECPIDAIFSEDEIPEGQRVFLELNRDLSYIWSRASDDKSRLPDAEKWETILGKLEYLKH